DVDKGVSIAQLGLGILDDRLEIALLLVSHAHALGVFIELAGVVGLGKYVFQENGMGYADGPQVLHGIAQFAALELAVALKTDAAHLNFGSFFDHEGNGNGGGRDGPHLGAHGSELPTMLGQQLLYDHGSLGHPGGIELALDGKPHLPFLKAVEHVTLRYRTKPQVVQLADGGLFLDINVDDPAFLAGLALEAQIIEVTGIPQGVEIAFQGGLVINVARPGKYVRPDSLAGNAAIAVNFNIFDDVLLGRGGKGQQPHETQTCQQRNEPSKAIGLPRPQPITPMASAGLRLRFEFWASAPGQRWRRGVVGTQNAATSVACSMESCHSIRSSVA